MTPVEATATCSVGDARGHRRRRPASARASSSPGRPVAAFALPELTATARSASSRARSLRDEHRRGEHAGRVKRAALIVVRRVVDEQPDVEAAAGLDARGDAGGAEAGRQAARRRSATWPGRGTQRERKKRRAALTAIPSVSGSPNMRFRFCTACDAGALPEVVDRREDEHLAGARVDVDVDAADVRLAHVAHARRRVDQLDERLVGVARRVAARRRPRASRERHVAGDQLALVERQEVRR